MRGWLAAPILDTEDPNLVWGLLQLSDKYEG